MLIAGIIAFCVLLFLVAILARGCRGTSSAARRPARRRPARRREGAGPARAVVPEAVRLLGKAVRKSGSAGRRTRAKID